jgi:hypothetical protein
MTENIKPKKIYNTKRRKINVQLIEEPVKVSFESNNITNIKKEIDKNEDIENMELSMFIQLYYPNFNYLLHKVK